MKKIRFSSHPDEPIDVPFDVDARLRLLSDEHKVKGMFISSAARRLGSDFDTLKPELFDPPRFGSYIPFANYSQRDYGRVLLASARKSFPDQAPGEGIRRVAREAVATFAESRVGKYFFSISKSPEELIDRLPSVLEAISNSISVEVVRKSARHSFVHARGKTGWADCQYLGLLEAGVLFFGETPRIDVEVEPGSDAKFDIRW